jgi:hypothetical protein
MAREVGTHGRREAVENAVREDAARRWAYTTLYSPLLGRLVPQQTAKWVELTRLLNSILETIPEYTRATKDIARYNMLRDLVHTERTRQEFLNQVEAQIPSLPETPQRVQPPYDIPREYVSLGMVNALEELPTTTEEIFAFATDPKVVTTLHEEIASLMHKLGLTNTDIPFDDVINELEAKQEAIAEKAADGSCERTAERCDYRVDAMAANDTTDPTRVSADVRERLVEQAIDEIRRRMFG